MPEGTLSPFVLQIGAGQGLPLVVAVSAILSVVTFAIYGIDKRAARKGRSRVPERVLHLLAAIGGWPGAYAGQRFFRHKTQKRSFRRIFWATLSPSVAALLLAAVLALR